MRSLTLSLFALAFVSTPLSLDAQVLWEDDFDSYAGSTTISGQGEWETWDANPLVDALVTETFSRSAPNSLMMGPDQDIVRVWAPGTLVAGTVRLSAWVYIPGVMINDAYFILLNTYQHGGPYDWSAQLEMSNTTGLVTDAGGSAGGPLAGGTLPLVTDAWVELAVEISLTDNLHRIYYDGQLLRDWDIWSGALTELQCLDLYSSAADLFYYDDVLLEELVAPPCDGPSALICESLNCDPGPGDVALSWTNPGGLESIEVSRDGAVIATLAGDATTTTDAALATGAYTYTVTGTCMATGLTTIPESCTVDHCIPLGYDSGFETLDASDVGIEITGQDEFYIPVAGSDPGYVFTYAGNALGLPDNPGGGSQFVATTGPGGSTYARAQRNVVYGTGVWRVATDIAVTFAGTLPSAQNIGSLSTQPFGSGTAQTYIALARWVDPATADAWNADYVWFDEFGAQLTESVPDPAFQNLQVDHWYRWSTTFDLDTNQITEVAITDLSTGVTTTHEPVDRYLTGGAAGASPPTGFRFFGGSGSVAGNTTAWDNTTVEEVVVVTGTMFIRGDANGDGGFDISDAVFTLSALFVTGSPGPACEDAADSNDDNTVDISDAVYSLSALFVTGSPAPAAPYPGCGLEAPDPADPLACETYTCP